MAKCILYVAIFCYIATIVAGGGSLSKAGGKKKGTSDKLADLTAEWRKVNNLGPAKPVTGKEMYEAFHPGKPIPGEKKKTNPTSDRLAKLTKQYNALQDGRSGAHDEMEDNLFSDEYYASDNYAYGENEYFMSDDNEYDESLFTNLESAERVYNTGGDYREVVNALMMTTGVMMGVAVLLCTAAFTCLAGAVIGYTLANNAKVTEPHKYEPCENLDQV